MRHPPTSSAPSRSAGSRATCSSTTRGEPTGYLHLKDVLDLDDDEYTEPVPPRRIRKLISISGATDIEDALATMRRTGLHVARVFDESGATQGALFLEDIIEELVGEVQDATRDALAAEGAGSARRATRLSRARLGQSALLDHRGALADRWLRAKVLAGPVVEVDAELVGGTKRPVRVAQQLAGQHDDVRLARWRRSPRPGAGR